MTLPFWINSTVTPEIPLSPVCFRTFSLEPQVVASHVVSFHYFLIGATTGGIALLSPPWPWLRGPFKLLGPAFCPSRCIMVASACLSGRPCACVLDGQIQWCKCYCIWSWACNTTRRWCHHPHRVASAMNCPLIVCKCIRCMHPSGVNATAFAWKLATQLRCHHPHQGC